MKFPMLMRRRVVLVPTLCGWTLIAVLITALIILAVRNLYAFLAVSEPVGARILIVEGWMGPEALEDALSIYRAGNYEWVITTGAPADSWTRRQGFENYAERAAAYLTEHGVTSWRVIPVASPESAQDRTYLSAVEVRDWARHRGLNVPSIDVMSVGPHARRSRLLYQLAFGPTVKVGIVAARQSPYAERWWSTSEGTRDVFDQAIALAWIKLFFWPSADPIHERYGSL